MKIGIDIGGSHIGIGVVDEFGQIIENAEKYIKNKEQIKQDIEEFIIANVNNMKKQYEIESIGIAVPGTVIDNKIERLINLGIKKYDLAQIIQENVNIKVKLKNDAKCAAIAEYKYGELAEYKNSLFLTIGTGVGGAFIYEGKILEGSFFPGYEFSHTIIHKNGKLCNCGKRGCFETYASLKRLKEKISEEYGLNTISGKIIRKFIRENNDDSRLKYIVNNYIDDLSIGISNFINIFEPDAICFGGSFSEYEDILELPLKEKLLNENLLFNKRDDIIIKHAKLKNDAGIIGATLI